MSRFDADEIEVIERVLRLGLELQVQKASLVTDF